MDKYGGAVGASLYRLLLAWNKTATALCTFSRTGPLFTAERYPAGLQAGGQTHPTAMFAARGELISKTTILCLLDAPPHDATSVLNAQHAVCSQRPNIRIQK